ncbi:MAG TPA: hypothetical protein VMI06_02665 [Terriglobia bacterium]|nr:hypothetical protein [Terriglobia bacterium]
MNEFERVIPILNVKNSTGFMNYYANKPAFRKKWDWGDRPTFGCGFRQPAMEISDSRTGSRARGIGQS